MPHRRASVLALALVLIAGAAAQAQTPPDPMATAECVKARQELELALAAARPGNRLDKARQQAAHACLGTMPAPPEPRTFVPPPAAVTPISVPATPAVPPLTAPAPGPVVTPRAPVVTSCDASGCWDSEGKRHNLQGQGPVLVGPRGLCTLQGGLLNCP